jgi:hypothetical protein
MDILGVLQRMWAMVCLWPLQGMTLFRRWIWDKQVTKTSEGSMNLLTEITDFF